MTILVLLRFCFTTTKKTKMVQCTAEDWIKLADQLPAGSRVTLTGGEPIVLKGFRKVFDHVAIKI